MAKRELKGVKLELGALRDELDRSDTVNNALKVCVCALVNVMFRVFGAGCRVGVWFRVMIAHKSLKDMRR